MIGYRDGCRICITVGTRGVPVPSQLFTHSPLSFFFSFFKNFPLFLSLFFLSLGVNNLMLYLWIEYWKRIKVFIYTIRTLMRMILTFALGDIGSEKWCVRSSTRTLQCLYFHSLHFYTRSSNINSWLRNWNHTWLMMAQLKPKWIEEDEEHPKETWISNIVRHREKRRRKPKVKDAIFYFCIN